MKCQPRLVGIRDGKDRNCGLPISYVEINTDGNSQYRVVSVVGGRGTGPEGSQRRSTRSGDRRLGKASSQRLMF